MLVEVFAVTRSAVVSGEVKFFAAQAKIKILIQGGAKVNQEMYDGVGIQRGGREVEPANAVAADVRVLLPACVFSDGGVVKLTGFPESLA